MRERSVYLKEKSSDMCAVNGFSCDAGVKTCTVTKVCVAGGGMGILSSCRRRKDHTSEVSLLLLWLKE